MFKSQIIAILLGLSLFACQDANRESKASTEVSKPNDAAPAAAPQSSERAEAAKLISEDPMESAVSKVQAIDTAKQLIRTADLKFRAKKVLSAALQVEQIAQQNGGFVLQNNFRENKVQQYSRRISEDSSEQTTVVEPVCHVLIRVPYRQLDTTLRAIGRLAEVLDYRNLEARDVSLDIMEQNLAALRNQAYGDAVSGDIAGKGDHLKDITAAREREFNARRGEDMARIERMRIEDQVRFSTITIDIYEPNTHRTAIIAFEKTQKVWRPGVFSRIGDGLVGGWNLFCDLVVALSAIWPFVLIAIVLFWFLKRRK